MTCQEFVGSIGAMIQMCWRRLIDRYGRPALPAVSKSIRKTIGTVNGARLETAADNDKIGKGAVLNGGTGIMVPRPRDFSQI